MVRFCCLFTLISFAASAGSGVSIIPANSHEAPRLIKVFEKARSFFESELGDITETVEIEIAPVSCLRTGYNKISGKIVFCPSRPTINAGLESIDVIHHEIFHALLCQKYPQLCVVEGRDDVHEALADVFAYRLNPDDYFGEGFYRESDYIRPYQTTWRVGLVRTPHERGMALSSSLIEKNLSFRRMLDLFNDPAKSEVRDVVSGSESSHFNRYRLSRYQEMEIELIFAEKLGSVEVEWETTAGIEFMKLSASKYLIRNLDLKTSEKVRARFRDNHGNEIGGWHYYFGPEI